MRVYALSASLFGGENVESQQELLEVSWTSSVLHGKNQRRGNSTLKSLCCSSSSPLERQRDDTKAMCKSIVNEMNYTFSVHEGRDELSCKHDPPI